MNPSTAALKVSSGTPLATLVSTSAAACIEASGVTSDIPQKSQRLGAMIGAGEGDRERNQVLQQGTTANELANGYKVTFARPGSATMEDLEVGVMLEGVTLRATAAPFGTR